MKNKVISFIYAEGGGGGGGGHVGIGLVGNVPTFRVSIFSKNCRTGLKIKTDVSETYDFPEQVKFILKALLLVKNSYLNL